MGRGAERPVRDDRVSHSDPLQALSRDPEAVSMIPGGPVDLVIGRNLQTRYTFRVRNGAHSLDPRPGLREVLFTCAYGVGAISVPRAVGGPGRGALRIGRNFEQTPKCAL